MVYPIVIYGHPALRKKAAEVRPGMKGLEGFIADMWETMYTSDGVGLAAPQVGVSLRLFVIDGSEFAEDDPYMQGFKQTFINPVILERSGVRSVFNEGCLSLPKLREDVERESRIRITWYDEEFRFYNDVFDGIASRIIQHEYDHLEGLLIPDRLNPLRRKIIQGKLNAIMRGKFDVHYKTILPKQKAPVEFPV